MALFAPVASGGKDFEPVPAGTHFAICTGVFDIGLQPGSPAYPAPKRILQLRYEIPTERVKWEKDGEQFDKPAIVYERLPFNMGKKALMRAMVESWYSMNLTDEQAGKVDIEKFLGRPATLSIVHNKSGDKVYANIGAIGPLPKGMEPPKAENPLLLYHADHTDPFDQLPKFLQDKIRNQLQPVTEDDRDERMANERGDGFLDDDLADVPF